MTLQKQTKQHRRHYLRQEMVGRKRRRMIGAAALPPQLQLMALRGQRTRLVNTRSSVSLGVAMVRLWL